MFEGCEGPWIGQLGGLMPLAATSYEDVSYDSPSYQFETTVDRVQISYFSRRPGPRTWSVSADASRYGDHDLMEAYALGVPGRGPWVWVPEEAAVTNVLTPAQTALRRPFGGEYSEAGPVRIGKQWFPSSLTAQIPKSWSRIYKDIPVVPGTAVTVSAWMQATTLPNLTVAADVGTSLQTLATASGSSGGGWQRVSTTVQVPDGATSLSVGARANSTRLAGLQVSWTDYVVPYSAGRSAAAVVVESASISRLGRTHRGGPMYGATNWTVREVGDAGW